MKIYAVIALVVVVILAVTSCIGGEQKQSDQENHSAVTISYEEEIQNWREKRIEKLKGENGWLNLAGLFWLEEGENSFEEIPGSFVLFRNSVVYIADKESIVMLANDKDGTMLAGKKTEIITKTEMKPDISGSPTKLSYNSLIWHIIQREDRFGIRLRDMELGEKSGLDSIPCYPVNKDWRISTELVKLDKPEKIIVENVLGMMTEHMIPSVLEFKKEGQKHRLYPMNEDGELWVIIADKTSAGETYGGGRYLGVEGPLNDGSYILDFNKAYNPPCAFTEYATCPLPPKENRLELTVTAGEKAIH